MFVVLEALQWIQLSFLRQNNFKKKDLEVFIIPSNQLKEDTWIIRRQVLLDLCNTDTKLRVSLYERCPI